MKPILLDFVRQQRHRSPLGTVLLVVAIAVSAASASWIVALQKTVRNLELREASAARRQQAAAPAMALAPEDEEKLAHIVQQLTVPWDRILQALERSAMPEVALLNVQHDPRQGGIKIFAEAKAPPAMLEYVRRLEATRAFIAPALESHRMEPQEPGRPVRFQVAARMAASP